MVVLAHEDFAAVEALALHALELARDHLEIVGFGLVDGLGEHAHFVDRAGIKQPDPQHRLV